MTLPAILPISVRIHALALPIEELSAQLTERAHTLSATYGGTSPIGRGKGPVLCS